MAIYLPGTAEDQDVALEELTPREIVAELDKHVVGQKAAKSCRPTSPTTSCPRTSS
jgi:ATP-dependent HslUV protease ATP-binding subunit HslU